MRTFKQRFRVGALAVATLMIAAACSSSSDDPGDSPGGDSKPVLRIGSSVDAQSWDPAQIGDANFVPYAQGPYDTLILREPDGTLSPMLATGWTLSDDNRTIVLTLRDDVTFSDGEAFNADAVKANFEHFANGTGPLAGQLAGLEGVEVIDETQVSATFAEPLPDILYNLSDAAGRMASPASLGTPDLATIPVGTGPYVMDQGATVQGSNYVFTARDDYWNPDLQKFSAVEYKVYPDMTSLLNALKSGQVDAGNISGVDIVQEAEATDSLRILRPEVHISWGGLLIFDREGVLVPELADVRVRQAMALALDRETFREVVFPNGVVTDQVFNEGSPVYRSSLTYEYDLERAQQLMAEAGVEGFTLTMPSSGGAFPDQTIQTAVREQLGAIGIDVVFENVDGANFITDMLNGKYAVTFMMLGAVPTDWFVVQSYLTPEAPWNPFNVSDSELQAHIDAIPGQSEEERVASFSAINDFVLENVWFAPYLWVDENFAVNDSIEVELQVGQNVPSLYGYSPAQ